MIETLPHYRSHKIVRAVPIMGWRAEADHVVVETMSGEISAASKLFARGEAQAGDYLVVYDDGYVSWSPRAPFEEGYTPLPVARGEPEVSLAAARAIVDAKEHPRVTEASIREKVADIAYFIHDRLTLCVIELRNGFFVVGKAAAADPRNHDPAVGRRYAYEDAFRQIWPLEGYALRERLSGSATAEHP